MRMFQTQNSCSESFTLRISDQFGLTEDEKRQERTLDKVESVNKGILKSVNPQEVNLSVSCPRLAYGNRLRENTQDFESLSQFTKVCALASFWYRASAGMRYKTKLDEDDGLGYPIPLCRDYTLSRVNPQSRAYAAIPGGTSIGPVIEGHIVEILDQYGLEIAIPSPNNPKWTSCVLISREKSRFVDDLHIPMSNITAPARVYSLKTRKKVNLAWRNRRLALGKLVRHLILAPGNWKRTLSRFLRHRLASIHP